MRTRILAMLTASAVAACVGEQRSDPPDDLSDTVTELLLFAEVGAHDSLWGLVADSTAANLAVGLARRYPGLGESLRSGFRRLSASETRGDSAYVFLRFRHRNAEETLAVGAIRLGARWRVYYVGLPDRI